MEEKKTIHFAPAYFQNPVHPIRVVLVGAGGNGSQMLSALARMNHALQQLGTPGLHVTVYDPDTVETPNIGRQLFSVGEMGQNKAECLVTRFNRMFGTDWVAEPRAFDAGKDNQGNIIITCVDNIKTRLEIGRVFRAMNITKKMVDKYHRTHGGTAFNEYNENYHFYWLDLGNTQDSGQAVLGSNRVPQPASETYNTVEYLPILTEVFDLKKLKEEDSGPSCSMAEALSKQDLFINSTLVQASASLLWSLLHDTAIDTRGLYLNLDNYRMSPMTISKNDNKYLNKTICK